MLAVVTPDLPDFRDRACDEVELAIYDFPPNEGLGVLIEATARYMARTENVPDHRFLDVLQQRTLEILTEENGDA